MFRTILLASFLSTITLATVRAEPIPQGSPIATYTTTLLYTPGQDSLYHGAFLYYNEFTNTTQTLHGYTELPGVMSGYIDSTSGEIRLAGQSKESYDYRDFAPEPGSPNDTNAFRLRVEIMDLASGEAGSLIYGARGGLITNLPADLRGEALLSSDFDAASAIVLGRNRYELSVRGGDTDSNAWLYGEVSVAEMVPEPGTILMAAFGVSMIAGLKRRRSF